MAWYTEEKVKCYGFYTFDKRISHQKPSTFVVFQTGVVMVAHREIFQVPEDVTQGNTDKNNSVILKVK